MTVLNRMCDSIADCHEYTAVVGLVKFLNIFLPELSEEVQDPCLNTELFCQEVDIVFVGRGFNPIPQKIKLRQHLVRGGTQRTTRSTRI